MRDRVLKSIDVLIEIGWLLIFFFLPLFFVPTVDGTWQISGSFLFQTLVQVICFFWLIKIILRGQTSREVGPLQKILRRILPVVSFIFILGLATIFSQSFYYSFWGYYLRKMGYLMWLHFFIFFLILFFNLKNRKQISRIFYVIVSVAGIVIFYGLLQILGMDFLRWSEVSLTGQRVFSTFGQPNFLASWLLLVMPVVLWSIINLKGYARLKLVFLRPAGIVFFLLTLVILVFTQSRSAWLSLLLMFFFFTVVFFWQKGKKKASLSLLAVLLGGIIFLVILNLHPLPFREDENPLLVRLKTFSDLSSAGRLRFFWWKNSWDLIKQKPWFGYGPETMSLSSPHYYQPECAALEGINQVPDRAHNDFLDVLLNTGIFGLLAYLFLLVDVFYSGFRSMKFSTVEDRPIILCLLTGLVGYLFSLQFSFHVISTAVYFWGYVAIILRISSGFDYED